MAPSIADFSIGGSIPGDSFLHELDPRTKLVAFPLILTGVFLTKHPAGLFLTGMAILGLGISCAAGWRLWRNGLRRFFWMLAIVVLVNLFFDSGSLPLVVGSRQMPFSLEALANSLLFALRVLEAIVLSMILTFTTTPLDLSRGFQRLAGPLALVRLPVGEMGIVMLLGMRFIPLLQQELAATILAQRARGVEFGHGSITDRAKNLAPLLVPALNGALKRSEIVASAMTARGFRPGAPRSEYRQLRFSGKDRLSLALVAIFFACQAFYFS